MILTNDEMKVTISLINGYSGKIQTGTRHKWHVL